MQKYKKKLESTKNVKNKRNFILLINRMLK